MIFLTEERAQALLTSELVLDAVERALIAAADGAGIVNPVVIGKGLEDGQTFSVKSGSSKSGQIVGLKVGSYWPGNEALGLARHGSAILLLDPETGRLAAVIDASRLNGPRTAAADALAARHLARADSRILALIGAGQQAFHEARALAEMFQLDRILIASRSTDRAEALCARLRTELDIEALPASVEEVCRQSDILVTVTPSREPLFKADWIKAGTHVASMGSDQAGKQELPVELLRRAKLFCDMPAQSVMIGELQHVRAEIASGAITVEPIGNVLSGQTAGRETAEDITVFDSSGLALQDLYLAHRLIEAHLGKPS